MDSGLACSIYKYWGPRATWRLRYVSLPSQASQTMQGCITWQGYLRPQLLVWKQGKPLTASSVWRQGPAATMGSGCSIQQLVPRTCSLLGPPSAVQLFLLYCPGTPVCSAWYQQALNKPSLTVSRYCLLSKLRFTHWAWQPYFPSPDTYGWSVGGSGVALAR